MSSNNKSNNGNPWKDFAAYTSADSEHFKGRDSEISKFSHIIEQYRSSVLYSESGLGKTSFIQAGIVPVLKKEGYYPIDILFPNEILNPDSSSKTEVPSDPCNWLTGRIIGLEGAGEEEVVWHFKGDEAEKENFRDLDNSLWWRLNAYYLADSHNSNIKYKPLIIFDQFEEVFTKTKLKESTLHNIFSLLQDISSTAVPSNVLYKLNELESEKDVFADFLSSEDYKLLFSFRKEYLAEFDHWSNSVFSIPELLYSRMALLPFSKENAEKVITEQGIELLNDVKDTILNSVTSPTSTGIESLLLSVVCSRLYDRFHDSGIIRLQESDLFKISAGTIIRSFCEEKLVSAIPDKNDRYEFESIMVDMDDKKRNRPRLNDAKLKRIDFENKYLQKLISCHLVREQEIDGTKYIELIHDRVAECIADSHSKNFARKAAKKGTAAILFFTAAALIAWLFSYYSNSYGIVGHKVAELTVPVHQDDECKYTYFVGHSISTATSIVLDGLGQSVYDLKAISAKRLEIKNSPNIELHDMWELRNLTISRAPHLNLSIKAGCPNLKFITLPDDLQYFHFDGDFCGKFKFKGNDHYVYGNGAIWGLWYAQISALENYKLKYIPFIDKFRDEDSLRCSQNGTYIINSRKLNPAIPDTLSLEHNDNYESYYGVLDLSKMEKIQVIGEGAFKNSRYITSVILPPNLNTIDVSAFESCTSLESIDFSLCQNVIIKDYAFAGCTSLDSLNLTGVNELDAFCFADCYSLRNVHFNNNISYCSGLAFQNDEIKCQIDSCGLNDTYYVAEDMLMYKKDSIKVRNDSIIVCNTAHHSENLNISKYYVKNGILFNKAKEYTEHIPTQIQNSLSIFSDAITHLPNNISIMSCSRDSSAIIYSLGRRCYVNRSGYYPPPPITHHKAIHCPSSWSVIDLSSSKALSNVNEIYVPERMYDYALNCPAFASIENIGIVSPWLEMKYQIAFNYHGCKDYLDSARWALYCLLAMLIIAGIIITRMKMHYLKEETDDSRTMILIKIVTVFLTIIIYAPVAWVSVYWCIYNWMPFEQVHTSDKIRSIAIAIAAVFATLFAVFTTIYLIFASITGFRKRFASFKKEAKIVLKRAMIVLFIAVLALGLYLFVEHRHTKRVDEVIKIVENVRKETDKEKARSLLIDSLTRREIKNYAEKEYLDLFHDDFNISNVSKCLCSGKADFYFERDGHVYKAVNDGKALYILRTDVKGLSRLEGHTGSVTSVAFSDEGTKAITGSYDDTAIIWDTATGDTIRTLKGYTGSVFSVAFSEDGTKAITGSDFTAIIWDTATGDRLRTLKGHTSRIASVAFSKDGMKAITGSYDKSAIIWDTATGDTIRTLKGHTGGVNYVAFSMDGTKAITGSSDETAIIWDTATGDTIRTLKGHTGNIYSVAFSDDGTKAISGSYDKTAIIWDTATGDTIRTLKGHIAGVSSVAFSKDGKKAITGSYDKTAIIWDYACEDTDTFLQTLGVRIGDASSVAFSKDGKKAITGSYDDTAIIWDTATGDTIRTLKGHTNRIASVAFSRDGMKAITGSSDSTAIIWNAATGDTIRTLKGHIAGVSSVAFSKDGKKAITGSYDKTAIIWNAATGDTIRTLKGHTYSVTSVALSKDGKKAITGSSDNTAIIWNAATGDTIRTLQGHTGDIYSVAFSEDGKKAITGSDDNTAIVWDIKTGKKLLVIYDVNRVLGPSSDGRSILLQSDEGIYSIVPSDVNRIFNESYKKVKKEFYTKGKNKHTPQK